MNFTHKHFLWNELDMHYGFLHEKIFWVVKMYYGCPLEHDAPKLVTLEHNKSKSTNEFTRFCIELGEFPMNSSNCLVINKLIIDK
jgi:hypothetical protein